MSASANPASAPSGYTTGNDSHYNTHVTFVVHGVGAPKAPGQYVDGATDSFANAWGKRNEIPLRRTTYNAHPKTGGSVEYSVFDASEESDASKCGGKKHKIVELQWADLSPAPTGFFGPIQAFIKFLYGLRKMSRACINILDPQFKRPKMFRSTSDRLLYIIEGPILGLNIVLLAAFLIAVIWPTEIQDHSAAALAGLTGLIFMLAPGKHAFKPWCAGFGALLLGVAFADSLSVDTSIVDPENDLFNVSPLIGGYARYMQGFTVLVLLLGLIVNTGIALVALKWALFRNPVSTKDLSDKERNDRKKTYEVQVFVAALATRLWMTLIPVLWFVIFSLAPKTINSGLLNEGNIDVLQSGATPLYGLNWFILFLILTGSIVSALTFSDGAPKKRAYAADTRVIAGSALVGSVVISAILYLVGIVWLYITVSSDLTFSSFSEFFDSFERLSRGFAAVEGLESTSSWYLKVLQESSYYGWLITAGIGVLAFFFREGIRTGLDFALDVTMYFEKKSGHGTPRSRRKPTARKNLHP